MNNHCSVNSIASQQFVRKNCERISRSATIHLKADVKKVFPLFGPVREKEWAYGWDPEILYSSSPLAEEKMIFKTKGLDYDYIWVLIKFEPDHHLVEYAVHTQNRIWFITVSCSQENQETIAKITYAYTALTDLGIGLNQHALEEMFRHDLRDWEEAINHYLTTGQQLHPDNASFT